MSEEPVEQPDLAPASRHFQILLLGTVIFLIAFFSLTDLLHTNTYEAQGAIAAAQLVIGVRILGCYVAFVSVVIGHGVLRRVVVRS
jgi:hypothetical protein